jgi:predicted transglutaminase-like cysteine proteinase
MGRALTGRIERCARDPHGRSLRPQAAAAATAFLALTLVLAAPAAADPQPHLPPISQPLAESTETDPMRAWQAMCERLPQECAVDASERAVIALTAETWLAISDVNRDVNERIRPLTDREHWGLEDRWDFAEDGTGDCEDYQLLKRRMLVDRGLPRRAMPITVVLDELGDGHAVLMVRTDRGDLILDNRTNRILPWLETGYVYVKREGQDSTAWVSLKGLPDPVATATSDEEPR